MTLVDTATAAVAAGVTDRTIRRWVHAGRIANHGNQRHIRIDLNQLDQPAACTSKSMSASL